MPLTRSQNQAPDVPDDRSPPPADSADDAAAGAARPRRSERLGSSQQPDAGVERLLDTVTQRMDAWEARLTAQAGEMEALRRELRRLVPAEPSTGQVPLGVPAAAVYGSAVAGPAVVAANGVLGAGASSPQCSLDVVELPTFDGTISWDAYRIQLDGIAAARGWDEQMKAWMLVAKLRGRATELLQNVPPDQLGSYTVLAGLLADHYGASGQPRVQYHRLRARRQEPGETYQDLAAAIERLALQSLPGAPQNAVALVGTEAFVDAIRLPEVQRLVRSGRPDSVRAAMALAIEAELTLLATRGSPPSAERSVRVQAPRSAAPTAASIRRLRNDVRMTCFRCGLRGHYARDCAGPPTSGNDLAELRGHRSAE